MKSVYSAIGLALAGVANAAPCSDQQTMALGLAYLQATSCDDIKVISAPDCEEDGQPLSLNVLTMGGLCDQLGFDAFEDQVLNGNGGGGGNSGSGGFGPQGGSGAVGPSGGGFSGSGDAGSGSGSGSGDSSEDCVGDDCCTLNQEIDFIKEVNEIQSCDDLDNVAVPPCKLDGFTRDDAKLACIYQGVDAFKAELKKVQDELEQQLPNSDTGSGSGSGSGDSSEECVGDDCCTLMQQINYVKAASKIQQCDDLDNVEIPTCKDAPTNESVKQMCNLQGVETFKAKFKEQQAELAKKLEEQLKDKDPSAAFGANPLALALLAPLLSSLFFVL